MSTTRPLLGLRRGTELTYDEQPSGKLPVGPGRPMQDGNTVDEFTVLEDKEEELKCAKPRVEQVFKVAFTIIGLLDHTGSKTSRQIWLQLLGNRDSVSKAKEYIRGLCDPELVKEEYYPVDMHCIFAGARGLFLDRLIRDTSAEVQVPELGRLRLLGQAEPVVMAQSRVQQFVALFQDKTSLPSDREPALKRAFKSFVEERDDKYTMELLLLPSALKEELLGLAHSPTAEVEQDRSQSSTPVTELSHRILDASFDEKGTNGPSAGPKAGGGIGLGPEVLLLNGTRPSHKRRSSASETRDTKRQYSLERREDSPERARERERRDREGRGGSANLDDGEAVSPETNLRCLVNFFRTMGYQQEVVERVVRQEAGQTEDTFVLLEKIDEETKRLKGVTNSSRSPDIPSSSSCSSSNMPQCRGKDWDYNRTLADSAKAKENIRPNQQGGSSNGNYEVITIDDDDDDDEDGENEVIPKESKTGDNRTCPMLAVSHQDSRTEYLARGGSGVTQKDYLSKGGTKTLGGSVKLETVTALRSTPQWLTATTSSCQTIGHAGFNGARLPPTSEPPVPPVTGLARFHQSLRTPYTLTLPNEPGRPGLRHIIIDGSNVAMAHGLNRFFSCRGIALAVEVFWRRGHREITVFVPQWRQKRDRLTTEQHFLNQLEDLRLLSFTPSREVCGQRIASHDDRFLLHLAEKTDGIIVTNDNLRDFVKTSETWRWIIQERLLQFTFVEDHFMIPDDPLGRKGPHIDEFLRKDTRFQAVYSPGLHSTHPSVSIPPFPHTALSHPNAHWSHSGPPEWHPPRRSPSSSPSPPPQRSPGETSELKKKLYDIFPDQKQRIDRILSDNPYMRDLNALSGLLLG
uniref:NEDD4-binding protein 1 n=1 Tax=Periophthalmus magnuspinnatus TaxID=409849 RepID=A0A3B3ZD89_9GOBI